MGTERSNEIIVPECSMCSQPATHRVKDAADLLCGRHRAWCEKRGIKTVQTWQNAAIFFVKTTGGH